MAYQTWVGPIPEHTVITPKCGQPLCIRPEHLSPKDKTLFRRDNQAASMFARRIRKEAKPGAIGSARLRCGLSTVWRGRPC
jgi:hypothetical protein